MSPFDRLRYYEAALHPLEKHVFIQLMQNYDDSFFKYLNSGSLVSAQKTLPIILESLSIRSVLDVGCGQGAWLKAWKSLGVDEILGIDGDYVRTDALLIGPEEFLAKDLTQAFDIDRKFDLVQSLEVAEHLPPESAPIFVESIVRHADFVLFSAAPVGQGGDFHINEQPYDYWRRLFANHGYVAFDCIRPVIQGVREIEPWYRYNIFLYVAGSVVKELPLEFRKSEAVQTEPLRDLSPWPYKARKFAISKLPVSAVTVIAKIKERIISTLRGLKSE